MSRVYFVCPWFGVFAGGAERAVRLLSLELRDRGVDARVLTTCSTDLYGDWTIDGASAGLDEVDGIPVHRFPVNKEGIDRYRAAVARWASGKSVRVSSQYDFFTYGISSDLLVESIGKLPATDPVVTAPYFHALNFRSISEHPGRIHLMGALHDEAQFYWRPVRDMFDRARGFLFLSPEEKRLAVRTYGLRRGRSLAESPVIGMGVELSERIQTGLADESRLAKVRRNLGLPEKFFVTVGRKEAAKGLSRLVEVYADWSKTRSSEGEAVIPLVILGGGDESLVPRNSIFRDLGFVSEEEKFILMKQALATINLSPLESFSFVVMESWLCGTPVVVSSGSEVTAGHVERSGGGFAIGDDADFANVLGRLSRGESNSSIGESGRQHVLENYNWDIVIDRFIRALAL